MTIATGRARAFWASLIGVIVALKLAILAVDSVPRVILGDSGFYLFTSLTGVIPNERSYTYGRLLSMLGGPHHDIGRILFAQVVASAIAALLLAVALRVGFGVSYPLVAVGTLAVTLEPLQLAYERFVMTEAFAGLCYAGIVAGGLWYLRRPRPAVLIVIALAGVGLLSLRLNQMLAAAVLPLALAVLAWPRLRAATGGRPWLHLGVALLAVAALHTAYRETYGYWKGGPAAYSWGGGLFLLGLMSPLLKPEDFPGDTAARLLPDIKVPFRVPREERFPLFVRDVHTWMPQGVVQTVHRHSNGVLNAEALARTIAVHAIRRDPLGAMYLGWLAIRTYFDPTLRGVYDRAAFDTAIGWELGPTALPRERELELYKIGPASLGPSPIRSWHASAVVYYPFILFCLLWTLLAVVVVDREHRPAAVFLFLVAGLTVATGPLVASSTGFRYLHPLAWLNILVVVVLAHEAARRFAARPRTAGAG